MENFDKCIIYNYDGKIKLLHVFRVQSLAVSNQNIFSLVIQTEFHLSPKCRYMKLYLDQPGDIRHICEVYSSIKSMRSGVLRWLRG